jgi:hypothetical protein
MIQNLEFIADKEALKIVDKKSLSANPIKDYYPRKWHINHFINH